MTLERLYQAVTATFVGNALTTAAFITAIWADSTDGTIAATIMFPLGALFAFAGISTIVEERKEEMQRQLDSLGYDTQVRP